MKYKWAVAGLLTLNVIGHCFKGFLFNTQMHIHRHSHVSTWDIYMWV